MKVNAYYILVEVVLFGFMGCAFADETVRPEPKFLSRQKMVDCKVAILEGVDLSGIVKKSGGYTIDEKRNVLGMHTADFLMQESPVAFLSRVVAANLKSNGCEVIVTTKNSDANIRKLVVEVKRFDVKLQTSAFVGGGNVSSYISFVVSETNNGSSEPVSCTAKDTMPYNPTFEGFRVYENAINRAVDIALEGCGSNLLSLSKNSAAKTLSP